MVLTDEQYAELQKYLGAYKAVVAAPNYRSASKSERRQIKNDAERAAAIASPVAQRWYESTILGMKIYRIGKSPDWKEIFKDKDAQLGHAVMQRLGSAFSAYDGVNAEANGNSAPNGSETHVVESATAASSALPVLLDAAAILERPSLSNREAKKRYMELVKGYSLLPPDQMIGILWGYSRQMVNRIRGELEILGYEFAAVDFPEYSYKQGGKWWRVVKRPPTAEEIKEQMKAKIDSMTPDELLRAFTEFLEERSK